MPVPEPAGGGDAPLGGAGVVVGGEGAGGDGAVVVGVEGEAGAGAAGGAGGAGVGGEAGDPVPDPADALLARPEVSSASPGAAATIAPASAAGPALADAADPAVADAADPALADAGAHTRMSRTEAAASAAANEIGQAARTCLPPSGALREPGAVT